MNVLVAIELLGAILSLVTRATAAAAQITSVIQTARRENRDISDEELAGLATESDRLTQETLAALREAAKR